MNIAFLTDQYVTDDKNEGGVGNYLAKMATALSNEGHQVEVFALGNDQNSTITIDNIIILNIKKQKVNFSY